MSEIEQKVKTIVAKQLNIQDEIKAGNSFVDDLGADNSLADGELHVTTNQDNIS